MPREELPERHRWSGSKEYERFPVTVRKNGVAFDPTDPALPVHMAFLPKGTDPTDEWVTGDWEPEGSKHFARTLIGPGTATELVKGTYIVWLRITDNPEIPAWQVATLKVY